MNASRKTALLLATLSACALLAGTACDFSIPEGGATPTPHNPFCDEPYVLYGGKATDETCAVILAAEAAGTVQSNGQYVPTLVTTSGEVVGTSSGLYVQWNSPLGESTEC